MITEKELRKLLAASVYVRGDQRLSECYCIDCTADYAAQMVMRAILGDDQEATRLIEEQFAQASRLKEKRHG